MAVVLGMVVAACMADATPLVVDPFDSSDEFEPWTAKSSPGEGAANADTFAAHDYDFGGSHDSALRVTRDPEPGLGGEDYIFTTDSDLLAGLGTYWVEFDFYAGADDLGTGPADNPAGLDLYFKGATSGTVWKHAYNPAGWSGWEHLTGNFDYAFGWFGGLEAAFATDLADASEVGIVLNYQDWDGQVYGLDNFGLHAPEPETYAALAAAFISLAITFRRRLNESLAHVRLAMRQ